MAKRGKQVVPAKPDRAVEIDQELTDLVNEGIDSLERERAVSLDELNELLDAAFERWADQKPTDLLNEGIRSLERDGPVSGDELKRRVREAIRRGGAGADPPGGRRR